MSHILFESAILFACVLAGGGAVLIWKGPLHKRSSLLLSFSGAYLLGLCLMHLLPYIFRSELPQPGLWIVIGFFVQIVLELISGGVEHGHFHGSHSSHRFPWTILIGLSLHAFFEGMPFGAHTDHQHSLLAGIVLHKVPVAIVLASMCVNAGFNRARIWAVLLIFAAMSPLGAVSYVIIEDSQIFDPTIIAPAVNALLVGILLHVSTTILFESSDSHRFNTAKFITIVIGLALAYIT